MEHLDRDSLTFVYDEVRAGRDDRRLRRDSDLHRVRRGAYLPRAIEVGLTPDQQYDLRIYGVLGTRRSPVVLSHQTAARFWSMPMIEGWPRHVHITEPPNSPRRSKNGVIVHRAELDRSEVVEVDGVRMTSVTRTLIDLARVTSFVDSVGAVDRALAGNLVIRSELEDALLALGSGRGTAAAKRVVDFASSLAESPGESFSRAVMHEWGFPAPELQHQFDTAQGPRRVDFWWPEVGIAGEFDGRIKYAESPEAAHWEEKQRANALFDLGVPLVRWTWLDLAQRAPFVRRLDAAGLDRRRPRGYSSRSGR